MVTEKESVCVWKKRASNTETWQHISFIPHICYPFCLEVQFHHVLVRLVLRVSSFLTVRVYHQSSSKRNQHYLNGNLNFQGDILACLGAKASKYIGNWKINLTKWASNLTKWGRYSDPNRRLHMESNKKRINGRKWAGFHWVFFHPQKKPGFMGLKNYYFLEGGAYLVVQNGNKQKHKTSGQIPSPPNIPPIPLLVPRS